MNRTGVRIERRMVFHNQLYYFGTVLLYPHHERMSRKSQEMLENMDDILPRAITLPKVP